MYIYVYTFGATHEAALTQIRFPFARRAEKFCLATYHLARIRKFLTAVRSNLQTGLGTAEQRWRARSPIIGEKRISQERYL